MRRFGRYETKVHDRSVPVAPELCRGGCDSLLNRHDNRGFVLAKVSYLLRKCPAPFECLPGISRRFTTSSVRDPYDARGGSSTLASRTKMCGNLTTRNQRGTHLPT